MVGFWLKQALEEKPKQRKPRTKSKDTPPPGQQNPGMDWQPPKGKQTKSRPRKSKKADVNVDPGLELQQQMLQQQLYQQMEQRHRLKKQKQGVIVEQGQQPAQQPPIPLNQHMVDKPGMLAQPSVDVPNPMRPFVTHSRTVTKTPIKTRFPNQFASWNSRSSDAPSTQHTDTSRVSTN